MSEAHYIGYLGYTPNPLETERYAASLPEIYGAEIAQLVATDDNRDALNYRALVKCLTPDSGWLFQDGNFIRLGTYSQGSIGSCVGNAEGMCLSNEAALEIIEHGEPETFPGMFSAEACYAIGREAGGMLGRGDGSYGSAMAKGDINIGTLNMLTYLGDYNLSTYSVDRCRAWGYSGLPSVLRPIAAEHKLGRSWLLKSVEEAWAYIGAGRTINICSNIGYNGKRDSDGAIKRNGRWSHSMACTSRRTTQSGRRLFLIHQSWGVNWTSGPYFEDQPLGSFYIDWENAAAMIAQGDTFVKADYNGFIRRNLRWRDW